MANFYIFNISNKKKPLTKDFNKIATKKYENITFLKNFPSKTEKFPKFPFLGIFIFHEFLVSRILNHIWD